ncbi:MAG: DEAD/DEAH box helicase [Candidatus Accumulibacter sp.]|uniref:DEAD/DEAH box helicase n=1 Tax=Accumulibacter sp. TaxID=2053492 RepID=UPI002878B477|nr:DEAD/DEAH box helicase [Accumulibacter sp.]MDS4014468.1 DEAD/DEAH box helicase [Accumulibacter sp.]
MPSPSDQASVSRQKTGARSATEARLSRQRKPLDLAVDDWQRGLRRQFGREQPFELENLGDEPVFSEFSVYNPSRRSRYRVWIRGGETGDNHCTCPDFATNDLGTCKHIEFTLARIAAQPAGRDELAAGFCGTFSELFLDYAGQRRVRLRPGSAFPDELHTLASELFDADAGWQLPVARFADLTDFLVRVRASGHELRCAEDALAFIAEVRDGEQRRATLDAAYPLGADSPQLAGLLKTALYPYQRAGALFAARAGRALIGDEMGLGKTVQAIAAVELFARHFAAERVLIVCPTSLKHQWEREMARFTERRVCVIGGGSAVRQQRYAQDDFCKIANYETISRDLDLIDAWAPDVVIVDEAQRIKNWNTIAARALKRIASPFAVVLTGTPLENRLEELISIVQFVDQHRLGPTWRLLDEHQKRDENGRVVGYQALDRIGQTLAPIMLRRRKAEVLEQLPERVDSTLFMPMSPLQADYHEENRAQVARIVQRWRQSGFLSEKDQLRLQCALQNMRMSCNSSFLLDHETDDGFKADELMTLLDDILSEPSAKVVVFSQWQRTHELIVRRLLERDWQHVFFHGGVPSEKRGELVDRFNNDADCRVFLSTDAGGVGLNLQHAAAVVVNMDLPWNPAVLEQRIGRVHRLGQTRGVQVINLVARGTIEESMLSVLAFKKSLFSGVFDDGASEITLHGSRLSKFMETVEQVSGAMSQQTIDAESQDAEALDSLSATDGEAEAASERVAATDSPAAPAELPTETPAAPDSHPETAAEPATEAATNAHVAVHQPDDGGAAIDRAPPGGPHTAADPWAPLLGAGIQLLGELAAAAQGERESPWVRRDAQTGERYLRLPVPDAQTVQRLAEGLLGLLGGGRR